MRKAIIDIGSNSVRIGVFADGIVIFRNKITSQLGENMASDGYLKEDAVTRTVNAVKTLVERAVELGVNRGDILAFATAAVRNSKNGKDFVERVKSVVNQPIDVLSGEIEGEIALLGSLSGGDGACLDIGGGSTELSIAKNGKLIYSHSIKIGAVVLYDMFGENREQLDGFLNEKLKEFDDSLEVDNLVAIGGTSTTCGFLQSKTTAYDANVVNGCKITKIQLARLVERLFTMTAEQRHSILHLEEKRAKIICGGALVLLKVMEKYKLESVTISENDNIEGYFAYSSGRRYER